MRKLAIVVVGVSVLGAIMAIRLVPTNRGDVAEKLRVVVDLAGNWSPPLLPSLFLVGIVVILLLWKLPTFQVARSKALTDEKRFDRENEARKTLAQIIAGVFVLTGLYSSVQTFDLSRDGQITDRFTKAIEQLGSLDGSVKPKVEVRLGGIYALERIARDSERDHWVIMEVLTAYVRAQSPRNTEDEKVEKRHRNVPAAPTAEQNNTIAKRPDIQAVLSVLGRREFKYDKGFVDLDNTDLAGANLREAYLSNAHLRKADLRGTDLSGANLSGADLTEADLSGANLTEANLHGTHVSEAHVRGAFLNKADLSEAYFISADLTEARLLEAHLLKTVLFKSMLRGAYLFNADLRGADLSWAELSDAGVGGADFSEAKLGGTDLANVMITQKQIDLAKGDSNTRLPAQIKRPANWPE